MLLLTADGDLVRNNVKSYTYRILAEKFLRKMCFEEWEENKKITLMWSVRK